MSAEGAETKSLLERQAERMREELVKAADKVKEIPQVKKALELYDEQMEKLRQAMVRMIERKSVGMIMLTCDLIGL